MKKTFNKIKFAIVCFLFTGLCSKALNAGVYDSKTKLNLGPLQALLPSHDSHNNYY